MGWVCSQRCRIPVLLAAAHMAYVPSVPHYLEGDQS
jgi:hypothetical protein